MKYTIRLIILILTLAACYQIKAQDTLILMDKSKIPCKLHQIKPTRIEYYVETSGSQSFRTIERHRVHIIIYSTGSIDTITKKATASARTDSFNTGTEAYFQGVQDGRIEYDATNETLCSVGSVCIPLVGIVTPIYYSTTDVKPEKIKTAKYQSSNNNSYKEGYIVGASKKRRASAWKGYCITSGGGLILYFTLLYSLVVF